jgi:FdhD protein
MMATPEDLEDFAVGFSLTEGVIDAASDIRSLDIVQHDQGLEVQMWLAPDIAARAAERRRRISGPSGCGLCGVESLDVAVAPPRSVAPGGTFDAAAIPRAFAALAAAQRLGAATRATHAAGLWHPEAGLLAVREDVGRHNALDKLVGHAARAGLDPSPALALITSRVSIEMVQKAAILGVRGLAAVSAPTDWAIRAADAAGLTLIAVARDDGFEVFTHPERILG